MSIYSKLRDFIFSPLAARLIGEPFFYLAGMRKRRKPELNDIRRVLVVKLDEIGDAVLLTPFVRELRSGLPKAWITLVVKPQLKELWDTCPYVNEVIAYDRQVGLPNLHSHLSALSLAKNNLWEKRFDLAIVPRWDLDYYNASYLAYFSGAPMRLGYRSNVGSHMIENPFNYDGLYTYLLDSGDASKHELEKNLELLSYLKFRINNKALELWPRNEDTTFADAVVRAPARLRIVYGIGANSDKRVWSVNNFLALAMRLQKEFEISIIILGGDREYESGNFLAQELGDTVVNLTGKTSLRQAAAVLRKCHIYIGNDSGLMHMAAVAGMPIVEISCHPANGSAGHYNAPSRFGPWDVQKIILQPECAIAPCVDACIAEQAHCIENVNIDTVQKAVNELIKQLKIHNISY